MLKLHEVVEFHSFDGGEPRRLLFVGQVGDAVLRGLRRLKLRDRVRSRSASNGIHIFVVDANHAASLPFRGMRSNISSSIARPIQQPGLSGNQWVAASQNCLGAESRFILYSARVPGALLAGTV
jgi:hypothetical protein